MKKIKIVLYGCGVMGRRIAQALHDKKSFTMVGAIDTSEEIVGKDLGELFNPPREIGVLVENNPETICKKGNANAAILTTTSHLKSVLPQIIRCVKAGMNVVSTSEELSYPWKRNPEDARNIDKLSKEHGVTVVGTGINPGYLMDTLPLVLTAPCLQVDSIKVVRMMNSANRRIPFQNKVGTGLTKEAFGEQIEKGIITGHVGLIESIYMIAEGLHWTLDEAIEMPADPVIAGEEIKTEVGTVSPGDVIGLTSKAIGKMDGREVIILDFNAFAGVGQEYDEIMINGVPSIHEKILGGVHGDLGTVAVTINTVPKVLEAPPGLVLMKDLPPVVATQ